MRPRYWPLSFHHLPFVAQITASSVKLRLSLIAAGCFCALWHEAVLRSVDVAYLTVKTIVFL